MKKILLSCACCLLAVGLLAGCDEDVEDVTPDDPNTGVVEPGGDGGEDGDGSGEGGEATTYLFGVEVDGVLSYVTGATQSQGTYRGVLSADVSEAVAISCEQSESTYYLSFDNEGVTNWITIVSGDHTNLSYATEKSPIYLHTTDGGAEYFGNEDGSYFLGYNSTYDCLYASQVSQYIDSSPVAGLYTTDGKLVAGGKGEEPEPIPEPVGTMVEEGTGVLGLYQANKGAYYYITGEITTSGSNTFLEMTTSYSDAAEVTIWKDDVYYYLTVGEGGDLKYIACPDTTKSSVALTSEPYCLQYNEEYDAWLTGNGVEFLATYNTFETMSWANVSRYLGDESEFIAHIYEEEQKLPAPEVGSITISGATSVYVGSTITLTAAIPTGYDPSVEWSIDNSGYATIEESSGLTCVVKGVSEGSATVTVKSTANPEAYATATISVEPVPAGLIGTFDFTSCTSSATAITGSDDLDEYWTEAGSNDLYLGVRQHESVYLGNGTGGQFDGVSTLIKLGTTSGDGLLQLKFALGTNVEKVVLTAHSWNNSSANQLSVNGVSKNCSTSGSAEELVYEFDGTDAYLLTFESTLCVTIHSIEIYGTYDASAVKSITSLTLNSDTDGEPLNVGSDCHITVSWEPTDTVFDIDELEWVSSDEAVATVTQTVNGATVHAVGTGKTTITATSLNGIVGTIEEIEVIDVLESSEIFTMSDIYTDCDTPTLLSGHQVNITFAKPSGSAPKYYANGSALRLYNGNTVTFTGTYENAPITSVVITYTSGYAGTITVANGTSTQDETTLTYTLVPTVDATDDMVMTYSANGRISQITVNYTLAA